MVLREVQNREISPQQYSYFFFYYTILYLYSTQKTLLNRMRRLFTLRHIRPTNPLKMRLFPCG